MPNSTNLVRTFDGDVEPGLYPFLFDPVDTFLLAQECAFRNEAAPDALRAALLRSGDDCRVLTMDLAFPPDALAAKTVCWT